MNKSQGAVESSESKLNALALLYATILVVVTIFEVTGALNLGRAREFTRTLLSVGAFAWCVVAGECLRRTWRKDRYFTTELATIVLVIAAVSVIGIFTERLTAPLLWAHAVLMIGILGLSTWKLRRAPDPYVPTVK